MKFLVKFRTVRNGWAFDAEEAPFGLDQIDQLRANGFPSLTMASIYSVIRINDDPVMELTEDEARRSGMFANTSTAKVFVPVGALTKNASYAVELVNIPDERVNIIVKHDNERTKQEWIAAGFPDTFLY